MRIELSPEKGELQIILAATGTYSPDDTLSWIGVKTIELSFKAGELRDLKKQGILKRIELALEDLGLGKE